MAPSSRAAISESALLIHVSLDYQFTHTLSNMISLQPRTETGQMRENSMTGAERVPCQISQAEVVIAAMEAVDLEVDPTTAESARSDSPRAMERSAILETGSAKDHSLQFPSQSVAQEKVAALEPMMAHEARVSGTVNHRQLHGVRVAHKAHKMGQDLQDANSRNEHPSTVFPQPLSKTANGEPRCDPMPPLRDRLIHPVRAARHHPLLLLLPPL